SATRNATAPAASAAAHAGSAPLASAAHATAAAAPAVPTSRATRRVSQKRRGRGGGVPCRTSRAACGPVRRTSTTRQMPATADAPDLERQVWDVLKTCYDPEIPVNIVDLGLVYDMRITPEAAGGNRIDIRMTLTAQGCGMGSFIGSDARQKLLALPDVQDANV